MDNQPKNYSSTKFQFEKCIDFLHKAGQSEFGDHFKVYPADYEIIFKILAYFFEDEKLCKQYKLSIRKGLLLTGPVGCGKTTLMMLFRHFLHSVHKYPVKSTREISYEFLDHGFSIINKYSKAHFQRYQDQMVPRTLCLDDLGLESTIKHFGNETNTIAEILLNRYSLFTSRGMITHATTNLNPDELENLYGNRVRSRMREMFNLISFNSKDKRM
ncbi:AAA family ATPase [Marivirga harenae]|uniref:AAA family ATPase n=1 Tax=Marivirga harenae TaxID=2010992 RepID=UPI0026DFEAEB|nr:AAA family ATPase [Marivirga harenae]WKV12394.1 ATPase [Marivirga harenae]